MGQNENAAPLVQKAGTSRQQQQSMKSNAVWYPSKHVGLRWLPRPHAHESGPTHPILWILATLAFAQTVPSILYAHPMVNSLWFVPQVSPLQGGPPGFFHLASVSAPVYFPPSPPHQLGMSYIDVQDLSPAGLCAPGGQEPSLFSSLWLLRHLSI